MSFSKDPFGELLARHGEFLARVEACIKADSSSVKNDQYQEFLSLLLHRIQAHRTSLQATEQNMHIANDAVRWGPIQATREDRDGLGIVLHVQGPASGDEHIISMESEATAKTTEMKIQTYGKMSQALARAYRLELAIGEIRKKKNESEEEQASAGTDQARIGLLKQYNDLRDVAQHFIGIIADNRSVPVRSLYADGVYGVGPED